MVVGKRTSMVVCWLASGLLVSACASTVQLDATASGAFSAGDVAAAGDAFGVPVPGAGGSAPRTGSLGVPGAAAADGAKSGTPAAGQGTAVGQVATPPSGSGSPVGGSAGTASPGATGASAPGIDADEITLGMTYAPNADAAQAALGNTAVTSGNVRANAEAVIRHINSNGGVGGRKISMVWHEIDAASSDTQDQRDQAACANFTEDHQVFAAFGGGSSPLFRSCIARSGAIVLDGTLGEMTEAHYAASPQFFDVSALSLDTAMRNLVDELARAEYFTGWDTTNGRPGPAPVKVGIVVPDKPGWREVVPQVLLPALREHGITVAPEHVHQWQFPDSAAGNGSAVADIQSAVLRFRSDGVTHVLPMEVNSMAFFAQPAENQRYRPRYGLSSFTGANAYAGSLVPYSQLNGAVGLGWFPTLDLPQSMTGDDSPYSGPGRARCLEIYKDAGIGFSDANAKAVGLLICDLFFSVEAVVEAVPDGQPVTSGSAMAALEGLGSSFRIASLPAARFGPGRHYPVTSGWRWQYESACRCLRYSGPKFPLR